MLVNAVIYTFPADRIEDVKRMLVHLRDRSREEAGCTGFDVFQSLDNPNAIVLHERWHDQAALDDHYRTPHFTEFGLNGIRPLALSRVGHRAIAI